MLKPEVSLPIALGVASVVFAIYSNATPTVADIRVGKPQNEDIEASRKSAAIMSAGVVGAISLMTKDPTIFVVGGAMVVGMDWWTRHANAVNPTTGRAGSQRLAAVAPPAATDGVQIDYAAGVQAG